LSATLETILNTQIIWRSAFNQTGSQIPLVGSIRAGDRVVVAWRHAGNARTAYLCCRVAAPLFPVKRGLVIDKVSGLDAASLIAAGYPANLAGWVEGIRLDEILECSFPVQGRYGGNNTIHKLAPEDAAQLSTAASVSPQVLAKTSMPVRRIAGIAPDVDRVEITASRNDRAFDAYMMVDWSSRSSPVTGRDSIWIASGEWHELTFRAEAPQNIATRLAAIDRVRQQAMRWRNDGKRVLVGFDFAFGYPAGFARALGLEPTGDAWRALHQYIAANVVDSPKNSHNRDAFAEECNRKVGAPGPFWGCVKGAATESLTQQRGGRPMRRQESGR
jgi:hypothetical protein